MADSNAGQSRQNRSQHEHQSATENSASFTERNRAHWDSFASNYQAEQWQRDMINQITAFILSNINWIGVDFVDPAQTFESNERSSKHVRVLDYACGPGTVTNAIGVHATEYVGVDLSEGMVNAYNARFEPAAGAENLDAHAFVGNLLDGGEASASLSDKKFFDFDLVVVGLGFHHFQNVELATKRLADRLKPGGIFLIIDFVTHAAGESHPAAHTIAHHGFSEQKVRQAFDGAGLFDVDIVEMEGTVMMRGLSPRTPFMARGRRP